MEKIKSVVSYILAGLTTILGILFMIQRRKAINAEAKNIASGILVQDAKLESKQQVLEEAIAAGEKVVKENDEAFKRQASSAKDLTPAEVEKYWKDKK